MTQDSLSSRYFISYTGVSLPLNLTNELSTDSMDNRITYFIGYYDELENLRKIEKVVYGEIEFTHEYDYEDQRISKAVITEEDEEPRVLLFDPKGAMTEVSA